MKVKQLNNGNGRVGWRFWCLGCEENHAVNEGWTFNGDLEKPTFSPSILIRSGHYAPDHDGGSCWCTYNAEHPDNPSGFKCSVCHTFVTDGRIQYLGDCTHALAGQTVELPDLKVMEEDW